jgi:hypothetical protein
MLEITVTAQFPRGDEAKFILREPTKAEWRLFLRDRYPIKNGIPVNQSSPARQALFDKLLLRVENACDDRGEITVSEKHRIPARMREQMIFFTFEEDEGKYLKGVKAQ